jgi:hypothetical protein
MSTCNSFPHCEEAEPRFMVFHISYARQAFTNVTESGQVILQPHDVHL